jgi:hypothetical protein
MWLSHRSGPGAHHGFLILVGLALCALCARASAAQETDGVPEAAYGRADIETIRGTVNAIVSDPEFMPRKTFGQWLQEKLRKWDRPNLNLSSRVATVIFSVFMIWCLLALVAILGHLCWTIWLGVRPSGGLKGAGGVSGLPADEITSPEELWSRSTALAGAGAFREAMGLLLLALLRRLETRQIVTFHRSKTNGEYVAEYPSDLAGREAFAAWVGAFERTIYGGLPVVGQTYEAMTSAAERIIHDAFKSEPI